jgi:hypothetical protein
MENGIMIFTALDEAIDRRIQQKIKNDSDYDKRFRIQLLDEINAKYKDNPYGLDINMIPVRLKDRNKQSACGWYADENNNIININTDTKMLLLQQQDLYTITKQRIMKRYAKSCTARSVFTRIITIVERYKEEQAQQRENDQSDLLMEEEEETNNIYSESDTCSYDSDEDII